MGIAPIPSLIPMRVSAPSAAPADLPTTRAIDFRQQQEQDDATYTPGDRDEEKKDGEEQQSFPAPGYEMLEAAVDAANDELPPQSTISVFA